ncbi:MAG TPA: TetR/AcrR family transcriptional regulator [Steroidobacteraceae bacterium]|nr:TetR/AcrR family transcriptional regulator [Steroidobacteraceae bacterium]
MKAQGSSIGGALDREALGRERMAERNRSAGAVKRSRRKRDPEGTREAILEAAREVLAEDGKEGLSVAQVAQRAGVNRGTAYQHFQTREQLIEATAAWVSEKLYQAVFGDPAAARDQAVESVNIEALTYHICNFAMENPGLGRVWLFELLSSRRPASDPFWRQYESNFERFAKTEYAQPGIDSEVASVLTLAGYFLWPVWARAHARSAKERQEMAERFAREIIRISLHGTLRPEKYAELDARLRKERAAPKAKA